MAKTPISDRRALVRLISALRDGLFDTAGYPKTASYKVADALDRLLKDMVAQPEEYDNGL